MKLHFNDNFNDILEDKIINNGMKVEEISKLIQKKVPRIL